MIAGGRSSRFGSDKALALLDGRALIEHAADAIRTRIDALAVCGRNHRDWTSLPDLPRPGLGPLGGIATALDHAARIGADRVLTIACDTPAVAAGSLDILIEESPAFCTDAPILGCWSTDFREPLIAMLTDLPDDRGPAVRRWAIGMGARPIALGVPTNINSPEDLLAL